MLANLAPFFCFSFFFFGDDGHFGDITKLAIEDTKKKRKGKKKKKTTATTTTRADSRA
jgi:hypothetical protein